jgi:hypothetical protein
MSGTRISLPYPSSHFKRAALQLSSASDRLHRANPISSIGAASEATRVVAVPTNSDAVAAQQNRDRQGAALTSLRLLLRRTMQCTQTKHQIRARNPHYLPRGE